MQLDLPLINSLENRVYAQKKYTLSQYTVSMRAYFFFTQRVCAKYSIYGLVPHTIKGTNLSPSIVLFKVVLTI